MLQSEPKYALSSAFFREKEVTEEDIRTIGRLGGGCDALGGSWLKSNNINA